MPWVFIAVLFVKLKNGSNMLVPFNKGCTPLGVK